MNFATPGLRLQSSLRTATETMSRWPWLFDGLRFCLEGGFRAHHAMLARQLADVDGPILDCGCGTGAMTKCFPAQHYVGIDCSRDYIARAQLRHPQHRFLTMDATRLKFSSGSFRVALVCGVLHHLEDCVARQVISELKRVLVPGGTLLLWEDVPARSRWNYVGRIVHSLDVGEHIRVESGYLDLLRGHFDVTAIEPLRSGCMDYTLFRCQKVTDDAQTLINDVGHVTAVGEVVREAAHLRSPVALSELLSR